LERILKVRAAALQQFGENAIPADKPLAELEDTLVPLYLLHRYQTEAAAKELGGLDYRYALRGDGQMVTQMIDPAAQQKALDALLETLSPETLTLPESLLRILPPRPPGYPRTQESFPAQTGVAFDPGGATAAAANITLSLLFDPQRASRLVEYHARDARNPALAQVIQAVVSSTWKATPASGLAASTQAVTQAAVVEALLGLAANKEASAEARAIAREQAVALHQFLSQAGSKDRAIATAAVARIDQFLKDPDKFQPAAAPPVPPGQPIGEEE
jgi:hypothetical protein